MSIRTYGAVTANTEQRYLYPNTSILIHNGSALVAAHLTWHALMPEPENGSVRLPDGRQLAYTIFGLSSRLSPKHTIVYYHGWPSSRLEGLVWHEAASDLGLRFVAVDRPGIGASSYSPKGSIRAPSTTHPPAMAQSQTWLIGCQAFSVCMSTV